MTSMHQPVSGFFNSYFITLSNVGSSVASGTVSLTFNNLLVLSNISETPSSSTSSSYTWTFTNLLPTTQKSYYVQFNFPANDFLMGTPLQFIASVQPNFTDDVITNNTDTINEIIVSSYDPNDKTVNLPKYITPTQVAQKSEMAYTVRFQNTGNWPAQTVFVIDTISENLYLSTFHVITASHNYNVEFLGDRILKFNFPNINLADSTSNEAASHGLIKYAIRCNNNIPINDSIINTAHIFFDFNAPVSTNSAINIVANPNTIADQMNQLIAEIIPNPATESTTIKMGEENNYEIQVATIDGRMLMKEKISGTRFILNTSSFSQGVYLVRITSGSKVVVKKLIIK